MRKKVDAGCAYFLTQPIFSGEDIQRIREAEETAVSLCVEIAGKLYDAADGFYLMTPFYRVGLVNRIIDAVRKL